MDQEEKFLVLVAILCVFVYSLASVYEINERLDAIETEIGDWKISEEKLSEEGIETPSPSQTKEKPEMSILEAIIKLDNIYEEENTSVGYLKMEVANSTRQKIYFYAHYHQDIRRVLISPPLREFWTDRRICQEEGYMSKKPIYPSFIIVTGYIKEVFKQNKIFDILRKNAVQIKEEGEYYYFLLPYFSRVDMDFLREEIDKDGIDEQVEDHLNCKIGQAWELNQKGIINFLSDYPNLVYISFTDPTPYQNPWAPEPIKKYKGLRIATAEDYKKWLRGHLESGGDIDKYDRYNLNDKDCSVCTKFYVATENCDIPLRWCSNALEIIVPKDISIFSPEGWGHSVAYYMEGYKSTGNVACFDDIWFE